MASSASASSRSTDLGRRSINTLRQTKGRAPWRGLKVSKRESAALVLLRWRRRRHLRRCDHGVGRRRRGSIGLTLAPRLPFLRLGLGGLVGELHLALTELLHHLAAGFLIFGVVDRRSVKDLTEAGQWHW